MKFTAQYPIPLTHSLLDAPNISHGFFTRHGGVSGGVYDSLNGGIGSNDDPILVETNREAAATALGGTPSQIRGLYQCHSAIALTATADPRRRGDALITDRAGLILTILTADCAPILLADSTARIIAAAHAGWRGASQGIIASTLRAMREMGATSIRAVIGPTIQAPSYQVGEDMRQAVLASTPWAEGCFTPDDAPNHYRFNLPQFLLKQLHQHGITAAAMPCDTYSDDRFFSHRRATHQAAPDTAPDTGRLMSMIRLTPQ